MEMFFILLIQMFMIVAGLSIFSPVPLSRKTKGILVGVGFGIVYPLFFWIGISAVFVLMVFLLGVLVKVTRKPIYSLVMIALTFICGIVAEYILQSVILLFFRIGVDDFGAFQIPFTILSSSLAIILMILLKKILLKLRLPDIMISRYGWMFSLFFICTLLVFYANILLDQFLGLTYEVTMWRSLSFLAYLALLISVLLVFSRVMKKEMALRTEKLMLEQEKQSLERFGLQAEQLFEFHDKMAKFKHDYKNMMLAFSGYIREDDMVGLRKYYSAHIEVIEKDLAFDDDKLGQYKNLRVPEIRGVLVSKLLLAQGLGIEANLIVTSALKSIPMEMVALSRMLGILLDNAIEEASDLDGGEISVIFRKEESYLMITVANTCRDALPPKREMFKKGFSTKGSDRGNGLNSLEDLIKKSPNARLETDVSGGIFRQHIKIVGGD